MNKAYTKQGTYFQFPLCALAYGKDPDVQLNAILDYGCRHAGRREWLRLPGAERQRWIELLRQSGRLPSSMDCNPDDCALAIGAEIIGVTYSKLDSARERLSKFDEYLEGFHQRRGRDPLVRIKAKYLFEARDGRGMKYRELTVLAAIFSVIGRRRKPVRISQAYLACRCLGFRTREVRKAESARRSASLPTMTEWQLRSTLLALRHRKLIHRFTYGRRHTYYGVGMTAKEFETQVAERAVRPFTAQLLARLHDEELTNAIRCQRATSQGHRPPGPGDA